MDKPDKGQVPLVSQVKEEAGKLRTLQYAAAMHSLLSRDDGAENGKKSYLIQAMQWPGNVLGGGTKEEAELHDSSCFVMAVAPSLIESSKVLQALAMDRRTGVELPGMESSMMVVEQHA